MSNFFWTGMPERDAIRIVEPRIASEGANEDRLHEVIDLIEAFSTFDSFYAEDVIYIQEALLEQNNWMGIESGYRNFNFGDPEFPDHSDVPYLIKDLFPLEKGSEHRLKWWYDQFMRIKPLADLNHHVAAIMVSVMYRRWKRLNAYTLAA